jgi:DNA-binding MarR family transcriptional regulator
MSFDDPRLFDHPSLIALDSSERSTLAKLLSLVLDAGRPGLRDHPVDQRRAELARWLHDQRRRRDQYLPSELFGEPAWDILLLLYWARQCQRRLSVSAVCASAGAPSTTALRYVEHLHRLGYVTKTPHPTDKRVSWLSLSDNGDQQVGHYLDQILNEGESRPGCVSAH